MTERYIKWKPKIDVIYENKPVKSTNKKFKDIKFKNKKIQNKKFKNKKTDINDLAVECFEF